MTTPAQTNAPESRRIWKKIAPGGRCERSGVARLGAADDTPQCHNDTDVAAGGVAMTTAAPGIRTRSPPTGRDPFAHLAQVTRPATSCHLRPPVCRRWHVAKGMPGGTAQKWQAFRALADPVRRLQSLTNTMRAHHRFIITAIVIITSSAVSARGADAHCYRWTDERGTVRFTDQAHAIPAAQLAEAAVWRCRTPRPDPAATIDNGQQNDSNDAAAGTPQVKQTTVVAMDREEMLAAVDASRRRFVEYIEERIRYGEQLTTTQLLTYNRLKRTLLAAALESENL